VTLLVDTNILVDVLQNDPVWADWSERQLAKAAASGRVVINPVVYAELAPLYPDPSALDRVLETLTIHLEDMPKAAWFLAGKAHYAYRRRGGTRIGVLSDFFIGAHAVVRPVPLLTRDPRRYRKAFPSIVLLTPDPHLSS
jgi:predicted nucleic acid-binding protein